MTDHQVPRAEKWWAAVTDHGVLALFGDRDPVVSFGPPDAAAVPVMVTLWLPDDAPSPMRNYKGLGPSVWAVVDESDGLVLSIWSDRQAAEDFLEDGWCTRELAISCKRAPRVHGPHLPDDPDWHYPLSALGQEAPHAR